MSIFDIIPIMTKVLIIRHADVEKPLNAKGQECMYPPESPITDKGRQQLSSLAERFADLNIATIYTSPYLRAVQSAEIIAEKAGGSKIITDNRLRDTDVENWMGEPLSLQQELMDRGFDIYNPPPNYPLRTKETREEVASRMQEAFKDIIKKHEGETIAIVSHGDSIRLLTYRLEHPEGEIPSMSFLSKERYLKRGEVLMLSADNESNIIETQLISNLEGILGKREEYNDTGLNAQEKK